MSVVYIAKVRLDGRRKYGTRADTLMNELGMLLLSQYWIGGLDGKP
jgi:hypothetical protein